MTESGGNSCVPSVASEQSSSAEIRQNSKDVRNDKEVPRRFSRICNSAVDEKREFAIPTSEETVFD